MELAKGRDNKMTRKDTLISLFVNGKREPYHDNPPTFSFLTLLFCHHNPTTTHHPTAHPPVISLPTCEAEAG
jgi:hypothetical protein